MNRFVTIIALLLVNGGLGIWMVNLDHWLPVMFLLLLGILADAAILIWYDGE